VAVQTFNAIKKNKEKGETRNTVFISLQICQHFAGDIAHTTR